MMDTARSNTLPDLESFDDLIAIALAEPDPCRLLTVLVQAETAYRRKGDGGEQAMVDEGLLQPVMARDWAVTSDLSLADVVETADEASDDWRFVMTAIMPGSRGTAPTPDECEPHLERMARALTLGADLSAFVFFDRSGTPVQIANATA
ncbi:hypothetical protein [Salinisphaera orenii]|uniref:hypothetical protein n=1 Tax=Salinisphaera orenii TaxID=856731 RepID=UPI0013A5F741